jgi:hypothetical protein
METRVEWVQAKCRQYTNRGQSMYRYLTVRNVSSYNAQKIWNCKMPLEVNIFLWQALHEKIQSAAEEKRKNNWQWGEFCALCGKLESVNHICFIASQHSSSLASKKSATWMQTLGLWRILFLTGFSINWELLLFGDNSVLQRFSGLFCTSEIK